MPPACSLRRAQFVPNWKLITMPETTPMPKTTAKILSQKKYRSRHRSLRLRSHMASMKASQLARPMEKAGNST